MEEAGLLDQLEPTATLQPPSLAAAIEEANKMAGVSQPVLNVLIESSVEAYKALLMDRDAEEGINQFRALVELICRCPPASDNKLRSRLLEVLHAIADEGKLQRFIVANSFTADFEKGVLENAINPDPPSSRKARSG